jgi:hypothetical protein
MLAFPDVKIRMANTARLELDQHFAGTGFRYRTFSSKYSFR